MREQLKKLRVLMKKEKITAWLSPCADAHGSEYIGAHDECTKYLSGFTGDSCWVLVLPKEAYLWTDGRYFVQAAAELKGSGVTLMKIGEKDVPSLMDFLKMNLSSGDALAFSARLFSARWGEETAAAMKERGVRLVTDRDLVGEIWTDRPARSMNPVWIHDISYADRRASVKIAAVRRAMKAEGCSIFISEALDETAYLTNLRGSDIECNPVFLSCVLITKKDCRLFLQEKAAGADVRQHCLENGITLSPYDSWTDEMKKLSGEKILADRSALDYETSSVLLAENEICDSLSPVAYLKCRKTRAEIAHMKDSHLRDGAYLTKFLHHLKTEVKEADEAAQNSASSAKITAAGSAGKAASSGRSITLTELDAASELDALRASDSRYISLSFPTISAYGPNAAMCHYMPTPENAAAIHARGLYLVDSGGQYLDGTTDVTRTIALGDTTPEERKAYTLVAVGMLHLLHAVFPEGTYGISLDAYARRPLWDSALDFNHGTGHGVGYLGNVHEMPVSVRVRPSADPKKDLPFEEGMVTSDEPGVYIEGKFGIRTENMIVCRKAPGKKGYLSFETLTYVPIDPEPLDLTYMTAQDIAWFNEYQKAVYEKISPLLGEEDRTWLKEVTKEIRK